MARKLCGMILCVTLLSGCMNVVDNALTNTNRSEEDVKLDEQRKPGEVLRFFGIKPGMHVFDIFAGGGYYSELMSYVVGPEGSVVLYNNNPWNAFVMKAVDKRLAGTRLPNVERKVTPPELLGGLDSQYDAAIFILGMHDVYYEDEQGGWVAIDKDIFLASIYRLIKSGGVLGVIDHNGAKGSDIAATAKELHRIDPDIIIRDLEAVGFTLEATSDILRNESDNLSTSVFLPENRWKTDRSVLRFRK